jgi:hypothetical protein
MNPTAENQGLSVISSERPKGCELLLVDVGDQVLQVGGRADLLLGGSNLLRQQSQGL